MGIQAKRGDCVEYSGVIESRTDFMNSWLRVFWVVIWFSARHETNLRCFIWISGSRSMPPQCPIHNTKASASLISLWSSPWILISHFFITEDIPNNVHDGSDSRLLIYQFRDPESVNFGKDWDVGWDYVLLRNPRVT